MHIEWKITLIGAGAILLLDTIASLLTIHFHFSYVLFCPATLALYFGLTYWAAKELPLGGVLTVGAFLGLVDATLGWKLSAWLGADPDDRLKKLTFSMWCITLVTVMIFGVLIALVAYLIASWRNKRESR